MELKWFLGKDNTVDDGRKHGAPYCCKALRNKIEKIGQNHFKKKQSINQQWVESEDNGETWLSVVKKDT